MTEKKTILVVDDLVAIQDIVSASLRMRGYNIEKAGNGKEALNKLKANPDGYSLILSDYDMPEMNGQKLLEKVRSTPRLQNKPFIMLTSRTEPEKVKAAKDKGLSAWVVKPFKADAFFAQINYAIEKG